MTAPAGEHPPGLRRRLLQVLACSALGPGLDGVLLFGLEPELVTPVADAFAEILRLRDGLAVLRPVLGPVTGEEELWLRPTLRNEGPGINFRLAPGPLVDNRREASTLVVVPDLVRLSLPGMRAAVQLLGADAASVERSGFRAQWRPRASWLAVCSEAEVGRLSPHLLDRFPIRLNSAGLVLEATPGTSDSPLGEIPEAWRTVLAAPRRPDCPLTEEAVARAVALFGGAAGNRRTLGLARLARALAVFAGAETCGPDRVEEAARLIGLAARPLPSHETEEPADGGPLAPGPLDDNAPPRPVPPKADLIPDEDGPAGSVGTTVALPSGPAESMDPLAADTGDAVGSPFPEDDAQFLREFSPLRLPWQRRNPAAGSTRGPVIGVRPADTLGDLAFVPTAIEAAKHQNLPARRALRQADHDHRLVVRPSDFRSYIRLPTAERMLVLLLDHTCRQDWDWQPALTPYVQWAYAGRAPVCLVEVGSRDAPHELRADHFIARSVLDLRVLKALHRPAGRSSPLAHGLAVTEQLLRRAFQQRSSLEEAWLVVVTDGRGNVPLEASTTGRVSGPVRRVGIEDALTTAGRIGAMGRMRLHSVVVDAARQPYPDLTFQLAEALGGVTVAGRGEQGVLLGGR